MKIANDYVRISISEYSNGKEIAQGKPINLFDTSAEEVRDLVFDLLSNSLQKRKRIKRTSQKAGKKEKKTKKRERRKRRKTKYTGRQLCNQIFDRKGDKITLDDFISTAKKMGERSKRKVFAQKYVLKKEGIVREYKQEGVMFIERIAGEKKPARKIISGKVAIKDGHCDT